MKNRKTTLSEKETPFQTIREAARSTGISEHALRVMLKSGELPYVKNGNRYIVNVPQLIELMDQKSLKSIS